MGTSINTATPAMASATKAVTASPVFCSDKSRYQSLAVSALAALWLSACGGGGGGGALTADMSSLSAAAAGTQVVSPAPASTQAMGSTAVPSPAPSGAPEAAAAAPAPPAPPAPAPSPAPASVSAALLINSGQAGQQSNPGIARLRDGGHVIAWTSTQSPTYTPSPNAVCWQRYGVDRAAVNGEVCIAAPVVAPTQTAVAALADGGFVIAWQVLDDGDSAGIQSLRYDLAGNPVGTVQQVNTSTAGYQAYPGAAGLAGGGHVVTWLDFQTQDVFAQRYGASGAPTGAQQRVNTFTGLGGGGGRSQPEVAALNNGGYVVVWTSQFQGASSSTAVYSQRYNADGTAAGAETLVSDNTVQGIYPKVAGLTGGGYVVSWNSGTMVVAQRFAVDGTRLGGPAAMDAAFLNTPAETCYKPFPTSCPPYQAIAATAAMEDGGYFIAWVNHTGVRIEGTYARRYNADGTARGPITRISGHDVHASSAAGNGLVTTWTGSDSDAGGIYAQRFEAQALQGTPAP